MKIATYNVNGLNARLPSLLRWLQEEGPDVACLQELKMIDEKFPALTFMSAGYNAIWHGQKSWNGVAILAKTGLELTEVGRGLPGDPEDLQSRFIEARVNDLLVCCLYLPNGNPAPGPKFSYKLKWLERLIEKAKTLVESETPVVLLGDYNVVPTDMDVYKPERLKYDAVFLPETKEAYRRLLEQGWTDSLRALNPETKIFTFWDYFRNSYSRDAGIRLDHLLLNPVLAKRLQSCGVDRHVRGWEKPSDHAPTWIIIDS
jgi:exodeoxyribonuclease-3